MRKIYKLFLFVFILVWILIWFYAYIWWFHKLVAFEVVMWPHTIAYVDHTGDYKLIGDKMEELYAVLSWELISTDMGIWIYFDDPKLVAADKLRSEWWVVIDSEDLSKLDRHSNNYKIKILEKTDYAVITFPFRNKLSYIIGMMRVYPVLWDYLVENNYLEEWPAIEMYDMEHNLIYYMVEVK